MDDTRARLDRIPALLNLRESPEPQIWTTVCEYILRTDTNGAELVISADAGQRHLLHVIFDHIGIEHRSQGEEPERLLYIRRPAGWRIPDTISPLRRVTRRRHTPASSPIIDEAAEAALALRTCSSCGREPDDDMRLLSLPNGTVCCIACMRQSVALDSPVEPALRAQ
jgi:hypothetical protein